MGIFEISAVIGLLFAAAMFLAHYRNRDRAMAVLVGVSAGLVGVQVMRVHIFTILVVLWCLMPNGNLNRGSGKRIAALVVSSGLLAITALYGDLVTSPTLGLQLLALTASACMIIAKATERDRKDMLYGLLALVTASSSLGMLQVAKIVPIEIWHVHVSSVGRPIGLYSEPDWLGLFAGLGLILAWRLPMPPALRTFCISVNAAAFVFAFARAAWIAVGAAVVLIIVANLFRKKTSEDPNPKARGKWPAILVVLGAGLAFLVSNPLFAEDFIRRLQGTFSVGSHDISGQARVRQIDRLWKMANAAPWNGDGLSANGRVGIWGSYNSGDAADATNAVSSNWLLAMSVDGKIMALPFIILLIALAVLTCKTIAGQLLFVVLLNSLFSNATFQPITWLLVALAFSAAWDRPAAPVVEPPIKQFRYRAKHPAY